LFALLLNYPWEFPQVPLFEEMGALNHWETVVTCSRATAGDSLIALLGTARAEPETREQDGLLEGAEARV
jgi:hypothetical protein